jgi:argininosuccinate lyase
MNKLWGGRFAQKTSKVVEDFTHSLSVDRRLVEEDLLGSIAHAKMLGEARIIPEAQARRIVRGLHRLLGECRSGRLTLDPKAEDVHTAIQSILRRKIGQAADRLHTGRSRNDQVVTDLRLYCRKALNRLDGDLKRLERTILSQAERAGSLILPGYTHLRHAQPLLAGHLLLSYLAVLERDRLRLKDAAQRVNALPLGAGALTGSALPLNRSAVARRLGFQSILDNSVDAVSARDFAVEILAHLALLAVHLSRIAEDLLLFSTEAFGFVRFKERMLTGSSMMPQKQNPDFLELIRAQSALIIGDLTAILTLLKGLPSGYQRDLQLDKEILFDGLDRMGAMLEVLSEGFRALQWNPDRIAQALQDESLYATDLAEYLVERGVAFAKAHRAVGRLLAYAQTHGQSLRDLPIAVWRRFSSAFTDRAKTLLDPKVSVERKRTFGSTHPRQVREAIRRWKARL